MSQIEVRLRIKCKRDIREGEILEPYVDEIYAKSSYGSTVILVFEATIHPVVLPKELERKSE
jgi:hypothetical protein